jgi:hypothetical protein
MKSPPNLRFAHFSFLTPACKQACASFEKKKARLAGELFILK